jgi:hypothetical protein
LQTAAWALDMVENYLLFKWIEQPMIEKSIDVYHGVVIAKWMFALTAVIVGLYVMIFKRQRRN